MGWDYLFEKNQPQLAQAILDINDRLNPNSINAHKYFAKSLIVNRHIKEALSAIRDAGLFINEWEINIMGYDFLQNQEQAEIAEAIFGANSILHPNSANAFDSYAESIASQGRYQEAVDNYQKAVDLAIANNDGSLDLIKKNLETLRKN